MAQCLITRRGGASGGTDGSGGLNFIVRDYATASLLPLVGETNEIAVITSVPIGSVMLAGTAPTKRPDGTALAAGDIWIVTNMASLYPFNGIKGDTLLTVYSQSAQQWNGTNWVGKEARIYYNGAWRAWKRWLYQNGNQFAAETGGWLCAPGASGSFSANPTNMSYTQNHGGNRILWIYSAAAINLTNAQSLKIRHVRTTLTTATAFLFGVGTAQMSFNVKSTTLSGPNNGEYIQTIDIAAINGTVYIGIQSDSGSAAYGAQGISGTIYEIWLE